MILHNFFEMLKLEMGRDEIRMFEEVELKWGLENIYRDREGEFCKNNLQNTHKRIILTIGRWRI